MDRVRHAAQYSALGNVPTLPVGLSARSTTVEVALAAATAENRVYVWVQTSAEICQMCVCALCARAALTWRRTEGISHGGQCTRSTAGSRGIAFPTGSSAARGPAVTRRRSHHRRQSSARRSHSDLDWDDPRRQEPGHRPSSGQSNNLSGVLAGTGRRSRGWQLAPVLLRAGSQMVMFWPRDVRHDK